MKYYRFNKATLNFEKVTMLKTDIIYIFIIAVCFTFSYFIRNAYYLTLEHNKEIENNFNELKNINEELLGIINLLNEVDEFDETNLRLIMQGMNIMFIDVAIAQSKLETSTYTSDIFIESGNLFGMKPAKIRPYTHFGYHRGHADYKGMWKLSVIDYALWQAREAKNVKTIDQYYYLLSKMYAEDPNYVDKLKKIVNKK
jgi:hypothetical protein